MRDFTGVDSLVSPVVSLITLLAVYCLDKYAGVDVLFFLPRKWREPIGVMYPPEEEYTVHKEAAAARAAAAAAAGGDGSKGSKGHAASGDSANALFDAAAWKDANAAVPPMPAGGGGGGARAAATIVAAPRPDDTAHGGGNV
jgi:hypothetical protein